MAKKKKVYAWVLTYETLKVEKIEVRSIEGDYVVTLDDKERPCVGHGRYWCASKRDAYKEILVVVNNKRRAADEELFKARIKSKAADKLWRKYARKFNALEKANGNL